MVAYSESPCGRLPGVSLLLQKGTDEARKEADRLASLVAFAVARQGGVTSQDYGTVVTVVELAAIQNDNALMEVALPRLASLAADVFQLKTTVDNLKLILGLRKPGEDTGLLEKVIPVLTERELQLTGPMV